MVFKLMHDFEEIEEKLLDIATLSGQPLNLLAEDIFSISLNGKNL